MCIALIFPNQRQSETFNKQHILKAVEAFVPGIKEIPDSFVTWQSIKHSYRFCYLELQKPRGKNLSQIELRKLQIDLQKHVLHGIASSCPYVFSPYNYEESYRQLLLLQRELKSSDDLPQISVHFKGQTPIDLEFLVCMVRPASSISLEENIKRLPSFVRISSHTHQHFNTEPHAEASAFSLYVPISCLDSGPIINQLEARKYIVALLEKMIGPFRDLNGGLFTKQDEVFQKFTKELKGKISQFSLFAQALFYSLKPVEAQITLQSQQAEILFKAFSECLREKKSFFIRHDPKGILIIKRKDAAFLQPLIQKIKKRKNIAYASLRILDAQYFVLLDPSQIHATELEKEISLPTRHIHSQTLRLAFQDDPPPSLNPHHVTCDVRCRVIYKVLFEGLIRLDKNGKPVMAGAQQVIPAEDGMSYTFILRPNCWSNGEKVTALHYVEGWRQAFDLVDRIDIIPLLFIKNGGKIFQGLNPPDSLGVHALDSNTLKVELEYPDPHFLHRLSQPLFSPAYNRKKEPQVFNGPYFVHNKTDKGLTLKQNPHFWDFENIHLDTIEIAYVPDPVAAFDLYEKNLIDWIGEPFSAIPKDVIPDLERRKVLQKNNPLRIFWLHMNALYRPFQSRSIRQALHLALDREEIHRNILSGQPLSSPLPPSLSLNPSPLIQDIEQAQSLFESGLKELTLTRQTFPPLKLKTFNHQRMTQLAEYMQKIWQNTFGIEVRIESSDWNAFRGALEKGNFQIGGYYESQYCPDPLDILQRFALHNLSHIYQWTDPIFQKKVAAARSAKTRKEKMRWIKEAEALLIQEMPVIPISHSTQLFAHHSALSGYVFDHTGCVDFRWSFFENQKNLQ